MIKQPNDEVAILQADREEFLQILDEQLELNDAELHARGLRDYAELVAEEMEIAEANDVERRSQELSAEPPIEEIELPVIPAPNAGGTLVTPGTQPTAANPVVQPNFLPTTQAGIAAAFARKWKDRLIRVIGDTWYFWDGFRWKQDETERLVSEVKKIADEIAHKLKLAGEKLPRDAYTAPHYEQISKLVKFDQSLVVTPKQLDRNPWMLPTPRGTINLRTGKFEAASPRDYMTGLTAVAPLDSSAHCPLWKRFIEFVADGDPEKIAFLQRMAGYILTGHTREQVLFFLYGEGMNGKTTFLNTLTNILGRDFTDTMPHGALVRKSGSDIPADVAKLFKKRLAVSDEISHGAVWDDGKIKMLTGGADITARFLHKNYVTFTPSHKIVVDANEKPNLSNVDEAIRRRFLLVPFEKKIVDRDKEFEDKLANEYPAILRWMIEGAVEWARIGLNPPASILQSSKEYLDAQNVAQMWFDENCERDGSKNETLGDLFANWREWCHRHNEDVGTSRKFADSVRRLGFKSRHSNGETVFDGIEIVEVDPS